MTANPWDKFFWNDWETDPALRLCSLAAQGLWMRMLCVCAKAEPKGYLLAAGRSLTPSDVASLVGKHEQEVETLLSELASAGVFSRDRRQRIYNRRMVRAEQKAAIARANGKLGGNPTLLTAREIQASDNPQVKGEVKPHKPEAISHKPKKETRDLEREFLTSFYPAYPHKVGKPAALNAYCKARQKASEKEILEGLERYKAAKPLDRAWCNPATFLNQERWADEPGLTQQPLFRQNGTGVYVRPGTEPFERWLEKYKREDDPRQWEFEVARKEGTEVKVDRLWPGRGGT